MSVAATVEFYFDLSASGGNFFTLDDTTKGLLDSTIYVLAGDLATDVSSFVKSVQTRRGRARQLDVIDAGTCAIALNNDTRTFDPLYTSSPYNGNLVPGKRVRVSAASQAIFDGNVEDWNIDYQRGFSSTATAIGADVLAALGRMEFDAWTTTAQKPGDRVTAVLNRSEVAFYTAGTSIDTGIADLQADSVTRGSNVLNYLQLVSRTERGYLFATRDGVLRFADRHSTLNQTNAVTFTDDGTDVLFTGIATSVGSDYLFNRVTIDRTGGTAQTKTDETSIAAYRTRTLSESDLLYDSDGQAADAAEYLLQKYKTPEVRVAQVVVDLSVLDDSAKAHILALDITNTVAVQFQPSGGGSPITQTSIIEGIAHDIDFEAPSHMVMFDLAVADSRLFFILDDPNLGVLDQNVLAL